MVTKDHTHIKKTWSLQLQVYLIICDPLLSQAIEPLRCKQNKKNFVDIVIGNMYKILTNIVGARQMF